MSLDRQSHCLNCKVALPPGEQFCSAACRMLFDDGDLIEETLFVGGATVEEAKEGLE